MEDFALKQSNEENKKRPTFLLILCILTVSNASITIINGLFSLVGGKPSESEVPLPADVA